jgi:DNA-binding FadR family transcriptional regulator
VASDRFTTARTTASLPAASRTVTTRPIDALTRGPLQPLGRRTLLHHAVQQEIKRYILDNNLKPGDPLPPEGELSRKLGVGRNSVREAVKQLEALGILEVRVGTGLSVRDFSFAPILDSLEYASLVDFRLLADLREARRYLERGLVERVIDVASTEQIRELKDILKAWAEAVAGGKDISQHDRAFHAAMWANLNNRFLTSILNTFWDVQDRVFKTMSNEHRVDLWKPSDLVLQMEGHKGILRALENKDVGRLRDALHAHYSSLLDRYERAELSDQASPKRRRGRSTQSAASAAPDAGPDSASQGTRKPPASGSSGSMRN